MLNRVSMDTNSNFQLPNEVSFLEKQQCHLYDERDGYLFGLGWARVWRCASDGFNVFWLKVMLFLLCLFSFLVLRYVVSGNMVTFHAFLICANVTFVCVYFHVCRVFEVIECSLSDLWCLKFHHSTILSTSLYHAVDITLSCCRHHSTMLTTSLYHADATTLSCWRHHSILLLTSLYPAVDITLSCWRHHSIMLTTSPCWRFSSSTH